MNTKKCSKCGWIYPTEWPGRRCRFCQEPFIDGICSCCGEYSEKLHNTICRACHTKQHREWRMRRRDTAVDSLSKWLTKIAELPYPSPALTEEQWMEACKHFGGCAYCGGTDIDARSMFIQFRDGGRYCAWNIIPACERCETARKDVPNPFLRMDSSLNRSPAASARKYNFTLERLSNIVGYLQGKMDEV